jgi:hypothetical protein
MAPPHFAAPPSLISPVVLLTILLDGALSWIGHGNWFEEGGWRSQAAALMFPGLLFFAWNPRLLWGQVRTPKRTYVLVVVGVMLGAANLIVSWSYGVRWQGTEYTLFVEAESVACIAILCGLLFRSWKSEPSFAWNLALHWVLFAWLAWFAFPYLGEPI